MKSCGNAWIIFWIKLGKYGDPQLIEVIYMVWLMS
jgi:hypothetical protein